MSDYVRRDMALKNLIQPLAGEYGMHNNEPQGARAGGRAAGARRRGRRAVVLRQQGSAAAGACAMMCRAVPCHAVLCCAVLCWPACAGSKGQHIRTATGHGAPCSLSCPCALHAAYARSHAAARTHRELFSMWYADLMKEPLEVNLFFSSPASQPAGPASQPGQPPAARKGMR